MGPCLSIITVCYNDLSNLRITYNSIRSQTYQNVQTIIVDGGSKDGTLNFIQENREMITDYISERDQGLYDAMNKGFDLVRGDYLIFLNAGDTFHTRDVIEIAMNQSNQADVVYGDAILVNENHTYKSGYHKITPKTLTWKDFKLGMVVCHQAMMVKPAVAARYNLEYKICADIDWAINTLKKATSSRYIDIVVCDFQAGGISTQRKKLAWWERWKILLKHYGILSTVNSHIQFLINRTKFKLN